MTDATAVSLKPDSGWARTNPVWSLEQLQKQFANPFHPQQSRDQLAKWVEEACAEGVRFPEHIADRFGYALPENFHLPLVKPSPRIVGLLVNKNLATNEKNGFVDPLIVRPSRDGWYVSPDFLPFSEINVQDALFRLLRHTGRIKEVMPELRGFAITEELNEEPRGASMTVAALLAVVDALNNYSLDLFRCACAVVEPNRDELKRVGSVTSKLRGFVREYGGGTLLVRHPDCKAAESFDKHFPPENIWKVRSFADLAGKLLSANQLDAVLEPFPLTLANVADAKRMIRGFKQEKKLDEAVHFAERLERASNTQSQPLLRVKQSIQTELEDLNRHIGRYKRAIEHSTNAVRVVERLGDLSSIQELLEAKVRLSAALFDGHDFCQAIQILAPFEQQIEDNPQLITAESRAMFYNTIARAKITVSEEGWKPLFEKSIQLQDIVDPDSVSRTKCYLIHGLLRTGREDELKEARVLIDKLSKIQLDDFTYNFLAFYRADYYRRCGMDWPIYAEDPRVDERGWGHPFGFYLQATARQLNRSLEDRVERFDRAAQVFKSEVGPYSEMNLQQLFAHFMELSSAILRGNRKEYDSNIQRIQEFLHCEGAHQIERWYSERIPDDMSADKIDRMLDRVPYF